MLSKLTANKMTRIQLGSMDKTGFVHLFQGMLCYSASKEYVNVDEDFLYRHSSSHLLPQLPTHLQTVIVEPLDLDLVVFSVYGDFDHCSADLAGSLVSPKSLHLLPTGLCKVVECRPVSMGIITRNTTIVLTQSEFPLEPTEDLVLGDLPKFPHLINGSILDSPITKSIESCIWCSWDTLAQVGFLAMDFCFITLALPVQIPKRLVRICASDHITCIYCNLVALVYI